RAPVKLAFRQPLEARLIALAIAIVFAATGGTAFFVAVAAAAPLSGRGLLLLQAIPQYLHEINLVIIPGILCLRGLRGRMDHVFFMPEFVVDALAHGRVVAIGQQASRQGLAAAAADALAEGLHTRALALLQCRQTNVLGAAQFV